MVGFCELLHKLLVFPKVAFPSCEQEMSLPEAAVCLVSGTVILILDPLKI